MNQGSPLVSIIVRTKDRPHLLKEALESIEVQTYRPLEVVLVNDGGCALPKEVYEALLKDIPLQWIDLEENQGRARAGNKGIEAARGDFIGFLDDDDCFLPHHVELLVACLEGWDYKVCYSDAEICQRVFDPSQKVYEIKDCRPFASRDFDLLDLLLENFIPLPCILFTRRCLLEAGGFDPTFELYEDWDLLLRIGNLHPFYHVPEVTVRYIQWSQKLQIAQGEYHQGLQQISYGRIIEKHRQLLTPEMAKAILRVFKDLERTQARLNQVTDECKMLEKALREEREKEKHLTGRIRQLSERIESLTHEQRKLQESHQEVLKEKRSLEHQLALIRGSRAWRFIQRYGRLRNALRSSLKPFKGKRIEHLQKGLRVVKTEGVKGLQRRVSQYVTLPSVKRGIYPYVPVDGKEVSLGRIAEDLPLSVTVIIPTRNAGPEFGRTLKKIRNQEGLKDLEILVIDSGSHDKTLDMAREAGARVLEISPEEFHHAGTRNLAAQHARGDVLVFTVQDATPAGDDWLYRLVQPIQQGKADAVSARQIPRTDADLFARWATWGYFKYLGYTEDTVRQGVDARRMDIHQRRRLFHLDSVCLAITKGLFERYPFQRAYAEDLDLGKRLFEKGHALLAQVSNAVIHSHNRPADYFFLREYINVQSLQAILSKCPEPRSSTEILPTLAWAYDQFCVEVGPWMEIIGQDHKLPLEAIDRLMERLREAFKRGERRVSPGERDPLLYRLLDSDEDGACQVLVIEVLEGRFFEVLESLGQYLSSRSDWGCPLPEVAIALHKCFAIAAGGTVAEMGGELPPELVKGI